MIISQKLYYLVSGPCQAHQVSLLWSSFAGCLFFLEWLQIRLKFRLKQQKKSPLKKTNTIASVTLGMKIYCVLEHNCLIRKAKRKSDWETVHPEHKRKIKFWSNQCDRLPSVFFTKETSDERQLINIGSIRPKLQRWTSNDLTIKERFKNCFVSGTDAFQWYLEYNGIFTMH